MEPFTNRKSADADGTRSDLGINYYYMSLANVKNQVIDEPWEHH